MGFDDNDEDEVELSIDDLHRMIEEANEIEIDLDDFVAYMEELNYERAEEDEREFEIQEYAEAMRQALSNGEYHKAFANAKELQYRGYSQYKVEIDSCYKKCADNGVEEALIHEADKYTIRGDGKVKPEAFPYLKKLSDMGYIRSFRWLADCYYWGIGCEKDHKKADRLYFEGMLFDKSEYCRSRYAGLHPELEYYESEELQKRIVKSLVLGGSWHAGYARTKIAELILDGVIKDYKAEAAYALLKNEGYTDDGISYYRLGECVLNGLGTTKDPIVAKQILESAISDIEWIVDDLSDEWAKEIMEDSFHTEKEYLDASEHVYELLDYAEESIERLGEYEVYLAHDGVVDEEQIYDDWCEEKPLFIKRSAKE